MGKNGKKDKKDPLAHMPFWLEDFTDDLIPTEVPAPAEVPAPVHISQDSDSEYSTKVATKSRTHSIFTHFQRRKLRRLLENKKITKTSCRRRGDEALPGAEKFGDLITADHKVLNVRHLIDPRQLASLKEPSDE